MLSTGGGVKREKQTPAKQLGLDGIAEDKIVVPWGPPKRLFESNSDVSPEAVKKAADTWQLSPAQREVLSALCLEKLSSTSKIAERLQNSRRTVEKHFEFLFASSGVHSRAELILEVSEFERRPEPKVLPVGIEQVS
jgi:DNA-binding CsgD family transcriptional regulator